MLDLLKGLRKKAKPLYRTGWDISSNFIAINQFIQWTDGIGTSSSTPQAKEDQRIAKKPIDIFNEVLSDIPEIDLTDIDTKIKVVERRVKLMRDELGMENTQDECEALEFLKARKKLAKLKGKHDFHWQTATLSSVDALCKKYQLAYVNFNSYSKTVPMEAVDELEKFLTEYKKFSNEKPVLKLIIDDAKTDDKKDSRSAERKKDPILLAGSPFGKWFFMLGAWDKEVQYVDELIYEHK